MFNLSELTTEEQKEINQALMGSEREVKQKLERLSMLKRAFQGRPIDTGTVVTRLTDVQNILERSRFPTYPTIQNQVCLRMHKTVYGEVAQSSEDLADAIAESFISYRGGSRQEWVDQMKHAGGAGEEQNIYFGPQRERQEPKRRFWQRKPKPEHQELQE